MIFDGNIVVDITKDIVFQNINGVIHSINNRPTEFKNSNKFRIINPQTIIDEFDDYPFMVLCADVEIDEDKITEEEKYLLTHYNWRLALCGDATYYNDDIESRRIVKFKTTNINIEILDSLEYNQNKFVDGREI
jgi:hypothetical protein